MPISRMFWAIKILNTCWTSLVQNITFPSDSIHSVIFCVHVSDIRVVLSALNQLRAHALSQRSIISYRQRRANAYTWAHIVYTKQNDNNKASHCMFAYTFAVMCGRIACALTIPVIIHYHTVGVVCSSHVCIWLICLFWYCSFIRHRVANDRMYYHHKFVRSYEVWRIRRKR